MSAYSKGELESAYSLEDRGERDTKDGGSWEWSSSSIEEKEDKKYV